MIVGITEFAFVANCEVNRNLQQMRCRLLSSGLTIGPARLFPAVHAQIGSKRRGRIPPPPVHEGKPAIWHLSTVLSWFTDNKTREFDETLIEIARVNMQCNLIKEGAAVDRKMSDRFKALIV
jgi:hypothetical protein